MKIASISENKNIEKRVAITPETTKKYISEGTYDKKCQINTENEYTKLIIKIKIICMKCATYIITYIIHIYIV